MRTQTIVRLIKGAESYEVRTSTFVYFDDDASRRAVSGRPTPEAAEAHAKHLAKAERDRVEK